MTKHAGDRVCFWCSKRFAPRGDDGKRQVFCRPMCRRAFDAAGRRWVAEAIATGVLTVQELKNGPAAMRALGLAAASPPPEGEAPPQHAAPAARRAESGDEHQRDFENLLARTVAARRRG